MESDVIVMDLRNLAHEKIENEYSAESFQLHLEVPIIVTTPEVLTPSLSEENVSAPLLGESSTDPAPEEIVAETTQTKPSAAKKGFLQRARFDELVETERSFVSDLQAIIEGYIYEISESVLSFEEKTVVFGNIDELYAFHLGFLGELEACCTQGDLDLKQVAKTFIEADFIRIYGIYCSNHQRSLQTLRSRMGANDRKLIEALKDCQQRLSHALPLGDYLLKPVQRIMRYHLLLEALIKATPSEFIGILELRTALEKMKTVSGKVNSIKRAKELDSLVNGEVIVTRSPTLQEKLVGFEEKIKDFGPLVNESVFTQIFGGKNSERHLYMFTSRILSTKPRHDGHESVKEVYPFHSCFLELVDDHCFAVVNTETEARHLYRNQRIDARIWIDQASGLTNVNKLRRKKALKHQSSLPTPVSNSSFPSSSPRQLASPVNIDPDNSALNSFDSKPKISVSSEHKPSLSRAEALDVADPDGNTPKRSNLLFSPQTSMESPLYSPASSLFLENGNSSSESRPVSNSFDTKLIAAREDSSDLSDSEMGSFGGPSKPKKSSSLDDGFEAPLSQGVGPLPSAMLPARPRASSPRLPYGVTSSFSSIQQLRQTLRQEEGRRIDAETRCIELRLKAELLEAQVLRLVDQLNEDQESKATFERFLSAEHVAKENLAIEVNNLTFQIETKERAIEELQAKIQTMNQQHEMEILGLKAQLDRQTRRSFNNPEHVQLSMENDDEEVLLPTHRSRPALGFCSIL